MLGWMMDAIRRLNRWYDGLDAEHGVLRFMLFLIPMAIFISMINFGSYRVMCAGVTGMALMAFVRVLPIAFPRQ
jgi:hypothetical protein